jgi:hypothetical protein
MKVRTNFIEIMLKEIMIGKEMYNDTGEKIRIDDINYQPLIQEVYIKSGENGYKMSLNSNYDFELIIQNVKRIAPNRGKLKDRNK